MKPKGLGGGRHLNWSGVGLWVEVSSVIGAVDLRHLTHLSYALETKAFMRDLGSQASL